MLPHWVDEDALTLRDSVFATVRIPIAAVSWVQKRRRGHSGRSGFRVHDGAALLTYGDADVRITLDSSAGVLVNGMPAVQPFRSIDLSLDDPASFVGAIRELQDVRSAPD